MRQDIELIAKLAARQRRYAGFFHWGDKASVEKRVASELCAALARANHETLRDPVASAKDPPDIICHDAQGRLVAVEIVEAVSQAAAHENAKGNDVYRHWGSGEFAGHVKQLILGKDRKTLCGGPYARYVVCVFTDEPAIDASFARTEMAAVDLPTLTQVNAAYLLMSYDPHTGGYPVLVVPLPHNTSLERTRGG